MTVKLSRGGVYLVEFPNIDFRTWKPRPALLVQDPKVRGPYPDLLVAAITSSVETADASADPYGKSRRSRDGPADGFDGCTR